MKNLVLLIALVWANVSFGQEKCNCDVALNNLIKKIETEYPGYETKTKDKMLYNSFKFQLVEEAKITKQSECFDLLKKYTSFFRDGHIWIHPATSINEKQVTANQLINIDMDKFLKKKKPAVNSIEGVWKNQFEWTGGVVYEIGITKTGKNEYTGFVITSTSEFWQPKEVKFRLFENGRFEFYSFDKTKKTGIYKIVDNQLIYFKEANSSFIKIDPKPTLSESEIKHQVGAFNGFTLQPLTDKTSIIKIPSFDYPFVAIINDMFTENLSLIENSQNLIIDIRGNSGGTDNAYQMLLPYIMTNSIRNIGVEYLATQTLVDGLSNYIEAEKEKKEKEPEIKMVKGWIERFQKNMGKFVNVSDSTFTIQKIELANKKPQNVVVLIDKRVGSSAENFVMKAKQSKKVKVLGTVTSGGLDYAAARFFKFGCPEYFLQLPTFRSLRLPDYPIDNIGLQPDIYLDKSVEDWIQFAVDYLEKGN